jgi:anti-sigma B factor antagonist
MALSIELLQQRSRTNTLRLSGRLDDETAADLDRELDKVLGGPLDVLVFDLDGLEYTTSAGLRSFMRAQKEMGQRGGKVLFVNVQAPVQKVFDIVKAVNLASVFRNLKELDSYLDAMQRKTRDESEP